jgi:hypothetical protein
LCFLEFGEVFQKYEFGVKEMENFTVPHSIARQENSLPTFSTPAHTPCQENKKPLLGCFTPHPIPTQPMQTKKNKIGHSPSMKRTNITPPIRTKTNISNKYVLLRLGTKGTPFNFSGNF